VRPLAAIDGSEWEQNKRSVGTNASNTHHRSRYYARKESFLRPELVYAPPNRTSLESRAGQPGSQASRNRRRSATHSASRWTNSVSCPVSYPVGYEASRI